MDMTSWSRGTRFLLAALLVAVSIGIPVGIASADLYGTGGSDVGRRPDNHDHDWCWSTGWPGSTWSTDANTRHANLDSQTSFGGGTNQTCDSGTDVYWKAASITQRGTYVCDDFNGTTCDNASVTINTNTSILAAGDQRRKSMCHELGHSGGLAHYSGTAYDCMVSGSSTLKTYRTHAVTHLNNLS